MSASSFVQMILIGTPMRGWAMPCSAVPCKPTHSTVHLSQAGATNGFAARCQATLGGAEHCTADLSTVYLTAVHSAERRGCASLRGARYGVAKHSNVASVEVAP